MTPEKNYTIKEIIYETNDYFFALPLSPSPYPSPTMPSAGRLWRPRERENKKIY
jgi:hypothetical protein